MQTILANYTASITELKKSPTQLLERAGNEAIAILNHNVASAYLDYYLSKVVDERLNDGSKPVKVDVDDLLS